MTDLCFTINCIRKVFRPLDFFHILLLYSLILKFIKLFFLHQSTHIFPSILTRLPVPTAAKHPLNMMLPPPCFTRGLVLGFRPTWLLGFKPKRSTWFHQTRESCFSWSESFRCLLANSKRAVMCLLLTRVCLSKSCPINWIYPRWTPMKL